MGKAVSTRTRRELLTLERYRTALRRFEDGAGHVESKNEEKEEENR